MIDRPNVHQQAKYNSFRAGYPYLFQEGRVFELPNYSLEEYYAPPFTKTAEETKLLGKQQEKVAFAKRVGAEITRNQFESNMPVLADAIKRCCDLAFSTS